MQAVPGGGRGRKAWHTRVPPLHSAGELPAGWTQGHRDAGLARPCVSDSSRPPRDGACGRGAPTGCLVPRLLCPPGLVQDDPRWSPRPSEGWGPPHLPARWVLGQSGVGLSAPHASGLAGSRAGPSLGSRASTPVCLPCSLLLWPQTCQGPQSRCSLAQVGSEHPSPGSLAEVGEPPWCGEWGWGR